MKHYILALEEVEHPLRAELTDEELTRIYDAFKTDDLESLTMAELNVLEDIIFDHAVANLQTHPAQLILN